MLLYKKQIILINPKSHFKTILDELNILLQFYLKLKLEGIDIFHFPTTLATSSYNQIEHNLSQQTKLFR